MADVGHMIVHIRASSRLVPGTPGVVRGGGRGEGWFDREPRQVDLLESAETPASPARSGRDIRLVLFRQHINRGLSTQLRVVSTV